MVPGPPWDQGYLIGTAWASNKHTHMQEDGQQVCSDKHSEWVSNPAPEVAPGSPYSRRRKNERQR